MVWLGCPSCRLFVCPQLNASPSDVAAGGSHHAEVNVAHAREHRPNERVSVGLADPELLDLRPTGLVRLVFDLQRTAACAVSPVPIQQRILYALKLSLHSFALCKRDLQSEAFQGFVASCDTFYELDHTCPSVSQRPRSLARRRTNRR